MKMEEFLGKKYVLVSHENFEDYLIFLGKGYLSRKAALSLKPVQCLSRNEDGTYTLSFTSALASSTVTFVPGEQFEETKPDGAKVKSTILLDGNKMTHTQIDNNGKTAKHIREFYADKMIVTTTMEGFEKVVTRTYALVK